MSEPPFCFQSKKSKPKKQAFKKGKPDQNEYTFLISSIYIVRKIYTLKLSRYWDRFSFLPPKKKPSLFLNLVLKLVGFPFLLSTKKSFVAFNFPDLMTTKPLPVLICSLFCGSGLLSIEKILKLVAKRFCPTLCIALCLPLTGFGLMAWRSLALWFGKAVRSRSELASLGVAQ